MKLLSLLAAPSADEAENGDPDLARVTVSERRMRDALKYERQVSKHEHLKTRSMVLVMTAPIWGQTIMAAAGLVAGVIVGGAVATAGVVGALLFRR